MGEMPEFDENDPADAIADTLRMHIGEAMLATVTSPAYMDANQEERMQGLLSGGMVGILGGLAALTVPGSEAEMRAVLLKYTPFWFDRGLEICGRETLGEIQ
jgi:hypothetical protein